MKRSNWTGLTASLALVWIGIGATPASAQTLDVVRAVQAAQVDKIAQAEPPAAPSGTAPGPSGTRGANGPSSPASPDNMPIKRPDQPTNDKMSRQPPASAANAK